MTLHIPTMLVVSVFIFCLMGLLTLHAWSRETRERSLAYLGIMMLLASVGVLLFSLRGENADFIRVVVGNIILLQSAAMSWTSMRVFARRPASLVGILAGSSLWLVLCFIPAFRDSLALRVSIYSILAAGYGGLTLREFWRSRKELEVAYMPALILTLGHTLFYCIRVFNEEGSALNQALSGTNLGIQFFSVMLFESMLYVIGIGYVTLAMVKERVELRLKAAAYSDPLTGIGNRRSFMLHGQQLLLDCQRRGAPAALLLCDLDHFKRLNDSFGHAMGDQALIAFGQITADTLHKENVFGRIGGEEFACVLRDTDASGALEVAERIRAGFSGLPLLELGLLSVSIGIATTQESGYELSHLLSVADGALYGAKGNGRNQVRLASLVSAAGL